MRRKHLSYTLPEEVIEPTRTFMEAKPWRDERDDDQSFLSLSQTWANAIVAHYSTDEQNVGPVNVIRSSYDDGYFAAFESDDGPTAARIAMSRDSMIQLFCRMGEHLAVAGVLNECLDEADEGKNWGFSVFYRTNPVMFRARVREGRIHLDPYCLYNSATEQALRDYDIDPSDPRAVSLLADAQRDAIADAADSESEESETSDSESEASIEPVSETPDTAIPASGQTGGHTWDELRAMNTRQLRVTATGMGLTGTWTMSKNDLLAALGVPVPSAVEVR